MLNAPNLPSASLLNAFMSTDWVVFAWNLRENVAASEERISGRAVKRKTLRPFNLNRPFFPILNHGKEAVKGGKR